MKAFSSDIDNRYFKSDTYRYGVKNVSFVDYIDTSNSVDGWDMSRSNNGSIIAWVNGTEGNYHLYIGSNESIKAINLDYFFANMTNIESIDFSNLDTSQTTSMDGMFIMTGFNSTSFSLDLGDKFDTSNVTNMNAMFLMTGYNSTLFKLDLGDKFDTSKVTNMSNMFSNTGYNSPVFTLDLGDKFDILNVTSMYVMFSEVGYANNDLVLDLSSFTFDNVSNYGSMFYNFKTTHKIYVKNTSDQSWITSKGFSNVTTSNVIVKS